jgi:hypothetical protein
MPCSCCSLAATLALLHLLYSPRQQHFLLISFLAGSGQLLQYSCVVSMALESARLLVNTSMVSPSNTRSLTTDLLQSPYSDTNLPHSQLYSQNPFFPIEPMLNGCMSSSSSVSTLLLVYAAQSKANILRTRYCPLWSYNLVASLSNNCWPAGIVHICSLNSQLNNNYRRSVSWRCRFGLRRWM